MAFKIHLIIISCIIVAVYVAWQLTNHAPVTTAAVPAVQDSKFSIIVTHASWGLNCRFRENNPAPASDAFVGDADTQSTKLREDNVLVKVSELCNGKLRCDIMVGPQTLGEDPIPECSDKVLEVEYRCFSYDRPWITRSSRNMLSINCDKAAKG